MVSRASNDQQGRPNKFTDVGMIGRKTGLMVKDTGRRDSAGLEDMDAFFSPAAEKSPRRRGLAPASPILPYRTRQAAASDEPLSMSGTSSSIRDPKEVLASRKSLLAPHRSPAKTNLKSPAVRVQTPKAKKLDSPSRVKRLLSFTDLEVESFEEDNLPPGKDIDAEIVESPSVTARRSRKGKGLAQQQKVAKPVFSMAAAENSPDDDDTTAENIEGEGVLRGGDFGGDFGGVGEDDPYEGREEEEDLHMHEEDEEREVEEVEELDTLEEAEWEGEEDEVEEVEPLPQPAKGRPPNAGSKPPRSRKKPLKSSSSAQQAPKRPRTSPKINMRKEIPQTADLSTIDDTVRRSTRIRVPPLAHWKNERIVYELEGRRQSGPSMLRIKEIVRVDTPPQLRRLATKPSNSRKRKTPADEDSDEDEDSGEVYATIKSYGDGSEIADYKVAVAGNAVETRPIQGNKVRLAKVFQDGAYMASGVLDILVGGDKAVKPTKHSFMSFVVMTGKVEVKIHRTVFHVGRGGVFVVPRGNFYSIKNIGTKDCRLFFSQAVEQGVEEPRLPNQNE